MAELSNEAEFYSFMKINGPKSHKSKSSYISWLRYVNELYRLDFDALTKERIDEIYKELLRTNKNRSNYTSNKAVSNIKSSLNKYLSFTSNTDQIATVVSDICNEVGVIETSTKTIIETRLGQGKFRKELIKIWGKCALTQFDKIDLLVASHIKPWHQSNHNERLDPFNGLLLSPNLDKLFDIGYISFDSDGKIMISSILNEVHQKQLGISTSLKLYKMVDECNSYLAFHRKEVFIKI